MKRYALYRFGLSEPELFSDHMEKSDRYRRVSDWYNHADDVAATLEVKNREIAKLRGEIQGKDAILHHSAVAATAARNRINDLEAKLEAVRDRCEANNWMGTARMCEVSSPLGVYAISAPPSPRGSEGG